MLMIVVFILSCLSGTWCYKPSLPEYYQLESPVENNNDDYITHQIKPLETKRSKRQIIEILGSIPGLSQLLSNQNVGLLLQASLGLVQDVISVFKCCESVVVPEPLIKNLLDCVQDPVQTFVHNVSAKIKLSNNKDDPLKNIDDTDLTELVEAEVCTARCALQKLKMLSDNGLPSPRAMKLVVPMIMNRKSSNLITSSIDICDKQLKLNQANSMTDNEKCTVANAMVTCMQKQMYRDCPEGQRQEGMTCVNSLLKSVVNIPVKAKELKDSVIDTLFNFIISLVPT